MAGIPYDDRDGYIWVNGEMIPWREAKLHVLSHGLHYASSVFEGERVYDGNIFKLQEHSERLVKSANTLDMDVPYSVEEINEFSKETIKANNITNGYVRPIVWRGAEEMAVSAKNSKIHVAIATWEWPQYFFPKGDDGTPGIALCTSKWRRPHPDTAPVHVKAAGNYTIGTLAKHEAMGKGYDDALMLDYEGKVAESSGSNIFFVKDGALRTPLPETFLNGITRQTVIALCKEHGYEIEETKIMPDEIGDADEVFVTGTAAEITPVKKINDFTYTPGEVTNKLIEIYADLVRQKDKKAAVA